MKVAHLLVYQASKITLFIFLGEFKLVSELKLILSCSNEVQFKAVTFFIISITKSRHFPSFLCFRCLRDITSLDFLDTHNPWPWPSRSRFLVTVVQCTHLVTLFTIHENCNSCVLNYIKYQVLCNIGIGMLYAAVHLVSQSHLSVY